MTTADDVIAKLRTYLARRPADFPAQHYIIFLARRTFLIDGAAGRLTEAGAGDLVRKEGAWIELDEAALVTLARNPLQCLPLMMTRKLRVSDTEQVMPLAQALAKAQREAA